MRPLPILASSADLGINLQSVAAAANAALAEPHPFQFTGTGALARANHPAVNALAVELLPAVRATGGRRPRRPWARRESWPKRASRQPRSTGLSPLSARRGLLGRKSRAGPPAAPVVARVSFRTTD